MWLQRQEQQNQMDPWLAINVIGVSINTGIYYISLLCQVYQSISADCEKCLPRGGVAN